MSSIRKDDIDNANYKGHVAFNGFDVGKFFNDPQFGKMSFDGDVSGNGITSTSVTGVDSGTVNGTFYGSGAGALGGAYEVTKDSVTQGDVFSATKQ